jgi:hypothetical protein
MAHEQVVFLEEKHAGQFRETQGGTAACSMEPIGPWRGHWWEAYDSGYRVEVFDYYSGTK